MLEAFLLNVAVGCIALLMHYVSRGSKAKGNAIAERTLGIFAYKVNLDSAPVAVRPSKSGGR